MSAETLQAVEDAIRAHHADVSDDGGMLTAWVVGYEMSEVTDDGIDFTSDYIAAPVSPHHAGAIAAWASASILESIEMPDDD